MQIIDIEQGTAEWHELRSKSIGASDAPVIMEVSPWKTPLQLYEEKIGIANHTVNTIYMERGLILEKKAREIYQFGFDFEIAPAVIKHPHYDFLIASLDGYNEEKEHVLEIKCPGEKDHQTAIDGKIPEKYYPQLQHQMFIAGVKKLHYFSYNPDMEVQHATVVVNFDEMFVIKMLELELEFYECMKNKVPPPPTDKDYKEMNSYDWIQLAHQWREAVEDVNRAKENLKLAEEIKKSREKVMIDLANNHNAQGHGVKATKYFRKGMVDYSAIPELKDVDLDKYRKEGKTLWRFTDAS